MNQALGLDSAIVVLASPGGNTFAAIEIGKAIRFKNFVTLVEIKRSALQPVRSFGLRASSNSWAQRRKLDSTLLTRLHPKEKRTFKALPTPSSVATLRPSDTRNFRFCDSRMLIPKT